MFKHVHRKEKKSTRKNNRFQFNFRSFARLGEHDLSVTTDGDTQDIKITRSEKHPSYNKRDGTSDISVLYLEHDAVFTRMFINAIDVLPHPIPQIPFI